MKHRPLAQAIALALGSLPLLVLADSAIEEVMVTADAEQATTQIAHQIDEEKLKALRPATNDSASLLRDTPGVSFISGGGVSSLPVLHGMGDDRIRTKINGMDIISACANHMNSPLSYIDPSNVGKVTVFSGASPVSVGGDSIAGSILVEPAAPLFAEPGQGTVAKGRIGFNYRSNGDVRGADVSAAFASEHFSIRYQGATVESDNYKAAKAFKPAIVYANDLGDRPIGNREVGSTAYEATNQSITLGLRGDNHLLEFTAGIQDIPYQYWANQRMDMTGNESEHFALRYQGDYDWGKLEARAWKEHTRHKMQFGKDKFYWYGTAGVPCSPIGPGCTAGMPMDTEGDNKGLSLKADINLNERDLLRIGAEAQDYSLDDWWKASGGGMMWPNTFWNINNGQRDRLGVFAEWEAKWSPQWETLIGLRHERVEMSTGRVQGYNTMPVYGVEAAAFNAADRNKKDDNLDLTLMGRYKPDDSKAIEFGYSRKTRSPSLYERFAWSSSGMSMRMVNWFGDGNGYVGNLNLKPETAHTLSATFDWHDPEQDRWSLKVTPYFTHIDDYIDAARCFRTSPGTACTAANLTGSGKFVYLGFVNQSARIKGLDISGHRVLAEGTALGDFSLRGMLNLTDGENRTTGDNLFGIMPTNAKLTLEQKLGGWNSAVELELVADKDNVSSTRNELQTGGYSLVNLRTSYQYKQARFDVGVENLFDRFYNHPLGGTYLGQGATMGTALPWGTPVPGMGRSVYAGVSLEF